MVIESLNTQVIENQRILGRFFYRFHVSDDLTIGEVAEIMKFKLNTKIRSIGTSNDEEDKLGPKERLLFFNNRLSVSESLPLKDVYDRFRESDGWLYLDFLIEILT